MFQRLNQCLSGEFQRYQVKGVGDYWLTVSSLTGAI